MRLHIAQCAPAVDKPLIVIQAYTCVHTQPSSPVHPHCAESTGLWKAHGADVVWAARSRKKSMKCGATSPGSAFCELWDVRNWFPSWENGANLPPRTIVRMKGNRACGALCELTHYVHAARGHQVLVRCPRDRLTEDKLPKKTHRRLQANLQ